MVAKEKLRAFQCRKLFFDKWVRHNEIQMNLEYQRVLRILSSCNVQCIAKWRHACATSPSTDSIELAGKVMVFHILLRNHHLHALAHDAAPPKERAPPPEVRRSVGSYSLC